MDFWLCNCDRWYLYRGTEGSSNEVWLSGNGNQGVLLDLLVVVIVGVTVIEQITNYFVTWGMIEGCNKLKKMYWLNYFVKLKGLFKKRSSLLFFKVSILCICSNDVIVIAEENSNNEIMENAEIDVYKTQLKNTELESVENGRWIAEEKGWVIWLIAI